MIFQIFNIEKTDYIGGWLTEKGVWERKPEDGIKRIKAKSSAPFQEKGNVETDTEESVWGCWHQRWSAMPLKRLNQSGLVPLKRVKLEKVKQPMYRAKGKAAP